MAAFDADGLFRRAEQAFVAGRLNGARADLLQLLRMVHDHPAVLHLLALVEKKRGDLEAARLTFEQALKLAPTDPEINHNYALLLDALGEPTTALKHFNVALKARPGFANARFNRALLLQRLGRPGEAISELDALAGSSPANGQIQSARGTVLKDLERLDDAAAAYDAALAAEPGRMAALHGRARTALERGEQDASEHYRRALAKSPDDPTLQLGLAEALEAEGDPRAVEVLADAVAARPLWAEGQSILARMRWEAGEGARFTRDLEQALATLRGDRDLWFAYVCALAAAELRVEAAEAASRAQAALGGDDGLRLQEAIHASEAGDLERAERLYASLPPDVPGRAIHEAHHRIRRQQYEPALELAEQVRSQNAWDVAAWATMGLIWRATGDGRADWLHGQPGLTLAQQLDLTPEQIDMVAARLRSIHRTRAHPIGQSLRGGTQTRGRLFDRTEPEIRLLRDAVASAVAAYWTALPPADPAHPLLRWRDATPRLGGSWSVRLTGGGFHVAHIHSLGILSSACYLAVPASDAAKSGWLEIGRPPAALSLPLEPMAEIEPAPGRIALFPSTLYHGTRAFAEGERLTAAFDVLPG